MRKYSLLALVAVIATGCGGGGGSGTSTTSHHVVMKKTKVCSGLTDKCTTKFLPAGGGAYKLSPRTTPTNPTLTPKQNCVVVDVSDYQGQSLNWTGLAKYICGGITKAGESTCSTCGGDSFAHNWNGMRAAHLWHSAYWFVRPGNCTQQANLFVLRLNSVGYKTDPLAGDPDLDEEVSGSGQTSCMAPIIYKAFHRKVVVYTSPGTNPGGSHTGAAGLWEAEYGPTLHPIWQPVVLWQCSDGTFGCKTYVPGIGYDDVSHDMGITNETNTPTPSGPVCFGKNWQHTSFCSKIRSQDAALGKQIKKIQISLNTSNQNVTNLKNQLAPLSSKIDAIAKRANAELSNRHWMQLEVSAHNAVPLAGKATPIEKKLGVAESNAKTEQDKVNTLTKQLEASLHKYGYHH